MRLDRSVAPDFQPVQSIEFIHPETLTLGNGIQANILNVGSQPVIRLDWISESGRWFDSQPGESFFSLKMLGEGTRSLNSEQLAAAFQQYGAFLELTNGFDYSTISIYTLSKHLEPVLNLLHSMLTEPRFDQNELSNLKNIKTQEILLNREKNNITASQLFRRSIFGPSHPYGKEMNEKDVEAISIEKITDYYSSSLLNNSQIIASGKLNPEHIDLIKGTLGSLELAGMHTTPDHKPNGGNGQRKDLKGSLQTSIRYGKKFMKMDDPDFVPMLVVNEILGGYFGSRLMKNIREDKGYTYGIYSSLITLKRAGYLVIGTDVRKENADDTILEIQKEINLLKSELVGAEELKTVKNYMLGSLISSMDTAFDLAEKFKTAHLKGMDMEYYRTVVQTIQSIDSLTIQRLANKYLDSDSLVLVTVG